MATKGKRGSRRGKLTPFRENLRAARERASVTQDVVGTAVGRSRETVTSWENGGSEPPLALLPRLAKILHVDVKDLLAGYPEVPDRPTPPSTYDQFLSIMHRLEQLPTEVAQVAADQRRVPIVGYADCSLDLPVIERETGEVLWLNLPDLPADARAVIARHDSMESKGVLDGDFLLVVPIAQQPISNGETALVIIQRRGQNAVCKEIYIHRHGKQMDVYAYPLAGREKMASVPYEEGQEWEIKARVIGVFRRTVG